MRILVICLVCSHLLIASADKAKHNGHCNKNKGLCENEDETVLDLERKRLLFYDVNPPEGFNLRRDVYMRFAIMLAEAQARGEKVNWHLVLPPWHYLFHWKSQKYTDPPRPWSMFFDILALGLYVPVLELHHLMEESGRYGLRIDSLYVLQNFDDPFENGVFKDKWNIVGPCKYQGHFWGYQNITAKREICVKFQGSISQLWEITNLQPEDKKIMFAHGEIPLHDSYGTKSFWDCRKSMQFSQELIMSADLYVVKKLHCYEIKCPNYLAVHWRRQDFLLMNRSTSVQGTAKQIDVAIKNNSLHIVDIFIASDGTYDELESLQKQLKSLGYIAHFYVPDSDKYNDGQIAIIEQIICSRGAYFIGTHESTYTYRIQEEREILGFDSDTTFNRLCPDDGECEKPSRWTIVH